MTFLLAKNIPFAESERRYHYRSGLQTRVPVLSFVAFDVPFDLVVFGLDDIKEAPVANSSGGAHETRFCDEGGITAFTFCLTP
jgi:hypothetical protein